MSSTSFLYPGSLLLDAMLTSVISSAGITGIVKVSMIPRMLSNDFGEFYDLPRLGRQILTSVTCS